jgi:hypothetical protein
VVVKSGRNRSSEGPTCPRTCAENSAKTSGQGFSGDPFTKSSRRTTIVARPDGHIYNTIVNGIRNMGAYGSSIQDPTDRWAIVAYVRALQTSATGTKPAVAQNSEK